MCLYQVQGLFMIYAPDTDVSKDSYDWLYIKAGHNPPNPPPQKNYTQTFPIKF